MGQELDMSDLILIDTDVLVDFFRGHSKAIKFVNTNSPNIILSSIVVAELYAGIKTDAEQTAIDNFVSIFRVIPVNAEIAKAGGLYKCQYAKSHGIGLADAILAATAQIVNAELKTLNVKHYPMLKSLKPAYKK